MRKEIWLKVVPFDKTLVTLGLESGVDGFVAEAADADKILALGRTTVLTPEEFDLVPITCKDDEGTAIDALRSCRAVFLAKGWEIIPVENILACTSGLGLECESLDRARLAAGVLERGADRILVLPEAAADLKTIVRELKLSQGKLDLVPATITAIEPAGLGHRVCVDTTSLLKTGQGMLVGNSSAFTFLVNAETESNPYVAARPFRINAGAVHAYCQMPGDKTRYLEELTAGSEVLVVSHSGETSTAVVGRVKTEVRPMGRCPDLVPTVAAAACFAKGDTTITNVAHLRLKESDRIEAVAENCTRAGAAVTALADGLRIHPMEMIAELEKGLPRGPYAGCIGWIGLDEGKVNLDTGITIRSLWIRDGYVTWQAGAGIVFDSKPATEWVEVQNKARVLIEVMAAKEDGDVFTY